MNARPVLLCLHGWGGTKESFAELRHALTGTDVEILTPDLPGFGDEPEPDRPWTIDDYAKWSKHWLHEQLNQLSIVNCSLFIVAHSHGGRIAIKMIANGLLRPDHLFLCAAAGIRHPRHFKRIIGLTLAKTGKFFLSVPGLRSLEPLGKRLLYRLVRVHDYEKASPLMRQTMINVTQEDLRPVLPKIDVPTDIFWGTDDGMTPVSDAYLMHDAIKGSTLHVYPGVHHAVHRDRAREIADVIRATLRTDE